SLINNSLKVKNFDLIHASNLPSNISASIGAFLFKKKILWFCNEPILHMDGTKGKNTIFKLFFLKYFENLFLKNIDIVVSNSKNTAKNIKLAHNLNTELIYSGVDTKIFKKQILSGSSVKKLFFISRIEKHKNLDGLINIFKLVESRFSNVELYIAGDGSYLKTLKKKLMSTEISKKIFIMGRISETEKIKMYSKSDIFLFPVFDEPLGVVPMESMLCECPVVAFNSGGPMETILDLKTGFLCTSETEFSNRIIELLNDPILAKTLGMQGRVWAKNNFSVEQMVDKTDKLYRSLLNNN
ncbi:MAG: glycosyltransferase family 4 protein, partial [Nanoarchaeales archaeon]|nr:glycosyltransferase family 4 protein [Nanoarchaeales archaeon]